MRVLVPITTKGALQLFEQASRVLGWEEWKQIDAEYAIGVLLDLLSQLALGAETLEDARLKAKSRPFLNWAGKA